MVSVGLFVAAQTMPATWFQARPEMLPSAGATRRDHRTLVRVGQTLDVVENPLVPTSDVERVVIGPVGQAALGDRRPRERAGDGAGDRAGVRVPAVDAVVAADVDLAHDAATRVEGHVAGPGANPGCRPASSRGRTVGCELVVAVVVGHVGEPDVTGVADPPCRGEPGRRPRSDHVTGRRRGPAGRRVDRVEPLCGVRVRLVGRVLGQRHGRAGRHLRSAGLGERPGHRQTASVAQRQCLCP